jgi:hypothetical protein
MSLDTMMFLFLTLFMLTEQSTQLQNLLANPHLRDLLLAVDSSPNAANVIEAAMQEPIFLEFADVCLSLVDPKPNEES